MAAKKKSTKTSEDEISISLAGVKKIFTGIKLDYRVLILILLVLTPMLMSIHYRTTSAYLPVTEDWARNSVHGGIRNSISSQVNQQYPNLPAQNRNDLVEQQFEKVLQEQGAAIDTQVKGTADYFKTRLQTEEGQTYLIAIDPYFYYRKIRNNVELGHYYDEIKEGKPWDNHMYAPIGSEMQTSFHETISLWIFKIINFFNGKLSLLTVFFFMPVLFSALAVIPAFFLVRKRAGDFGGFVAAVIVAVNGTFMGRTSAGFADTDAYTVFFPLLITWLFIEAFESESKTKQIVLSLLAGLSVGVFTFAWVGWWYIFDALVAVLVAYLGYSVLKDLVNKKTMKGVFKDKSVINTLIVGGTFIGSTSIFIILTHGLSKLLAAIYEPMGFRIIKQAAHASLWPNVYTTVAELGDTALTTIVGSISGKLLFFLALFGLGLTMTSKKGVNRNDIIVVFMSGISFLFLISDKALAWAPIKYLAVLGVPLAIGLILSLKSESEVDVKYALFLTIWFVGTIYASTKGIRFILLLVPAFAVALGISLGMIQRLLTKYITQELKLDGKWVAPLITILLLFLLVAPVKAADNVAISEVPSMNDAWWATLTEIKEDSKPNAIINSWWDFGHWFKAVGDRAVTFDGASQNSPMAHWIGKVLLTGDETEAINILRMLDCGSYFSGDALDKVTQDTVDTVRIMNEIISVDKDEAREILMAEGFSTAQADEVLELTHCEPPENYFITSEDMVGKAGVWAHFGSWDFERAHIYTNLRLKSRDEAVNEMIERFGYDEEKATSLYFAAAAIQTDPEANAWISPWPNYVTGRWIGGCDNQTVNDTPVYVCNIGAGIQSDGNQQIVLEQMQVNMLAPNMTTMKFGVYDVATGGRIGETLGKPQNIAIAGEDEIEVTPVPGTTFTYDMLLDIENKQVMITHPMLTKSTFTKLFYLEGRYTDHFEKFSDKQGVNGQRIIVWKVDWDGES